MSASLIVLIPVVLLGLVTALCFVGCGLNTHGTLNEPYRETITGTSGIVACWPLDDPPTPTPPPTPAADILNSFPGQYTPVPGGFPPDPVNMSAAAPGTFALQQPGIVPGDVQNNVQTKCASFNGGFVQVPFADMLNQTKFTVEAWVKPMWSSTDVGATRGVVVSANAQPAAGWALSATSDNFWQATVAVAQPGMPATFFSVKSDQPIVLDNNIVTYLAMTFDGMTLTLFVAPLILMGVTPALASNGMTIPANNSFQQIQQPNAVPLFIGMGRPDLSNGLFPFNGSIQDVAYYGAPLGAPLIQAHLTIATPG